MNAQIPTRQHFNPQMLLRRFAHPDGKLFVFNKHFPTKGVVAIAPQNLFCEKHIYTAKDRHGILDVGLEHSYAMLERRANPIIERIVTSARDGHAPHLTAAERHIWDLFFYNQWKRVPDFQKRFFETEKFDFQLKKATAEFETNFRPLTKKEKLDLEDPVWLERVKQNAKVHALTLSSPRVLAVFREKGLGIAVIRKPGKSFVTGSFPVVKLAHPGRAHLAEPTVEIWLPIAHDVAVTPAPCPPSEEILVEIREDSPIRAINGAVFRQSTAIAGPSSKLIASLAHCR